MGQNSEGEGGGWCIDKLDNTYGLAFMEKRASQRIERKTTRSSSTEPVGDVYRSYGQLCGLYLIHASPASEIVRVISRIATIPYFTYESLFKKRK